LAFARSRYADAFDRLLTVSSLLLSTIVVVVVSVVGGTVCGISSVVHDGDVDDDNNALLFDSPPFLPDNDLSVV
jgi:hypothetical protein